jgi:predicted nucleic acid-binding protein
LATYYLESSALVKLYVRELGTDRMLKLAASGQANKFAVLSLASVEVRSAVRRRERAGEIDGVAANRLLASFQRHLEGKFIKQALTDSVLDVASILVDQHGLRAYDAVQLSGYLALRTTSGSEVPIFVCADRALLIAAHSERLAVLDPCSP